MPMSGLCSTVRRRKIARADAQRAEIILRAADGLNNCEIADAVGVTRQTVRTWRERFAKHRLDLIRNWFAKRPHWHTHFTPTSSSWINQVERFFALLAEKQIKRGAHTSVKELIAAIEAFISQQNTNPKPLRWTKSADDILATIERFCRRTLDVHARTGGGDRRGGVGF